MGDGDPPSGHEAFVVVVLSAISVACSLLVVLLNTKFPVLRQPPGRFVRSRFVFTGTYCLIICAYSGWAAHNTVNRDEVSTNCEMLDRLRAPDVILGAARFFETGIVAWQLVIALDVLIIVRDPFRPKRHVKKCQLFVWCIAFIQARAGARLGAGEAGVWAGLAGEVGVGGGQRAPLVLLIGTATPQVAVTVGLVSSSDRRLKENGGTDDVRRNQLCNGEFNDFWRAAPRPALPLASRARGGSSGARPRRYPYLIAVDVTVITVVLVVTTLLCLRLRTGLAISQRSRHRVTRQLLTYALGFSFADIIALLVHQRPPFDFFSLTVLSTRGIWDMLVWFTANLLYKRFQQQQVRSPPEGPRASPCRLPCAWRPAAPSHVLAAPRSAPARTSPTSTAAG
jgi:hypothetical protein